MNNRKISPWVWIPTLYFGQGIPYVVAATTFALIMYKQMGISNADAALYTSWLYLPWVIKPFWSPFVDLIRTKRWWIWTMQSLIAVTLAGVAFCIPTTFFLQSTLALLWIVAFSSATHDIAADGFYMLALDDHQQSLFVGIRSTFYRIAMIIGQGGLVMLAGWLEKRYGVIAKAWSTTFIIISLLFFAMAIYHYIILPHPVEKEKDNDIIKGFFGTFLDFFNKKQIWIALAFILSYRLGEAQLVKVASPFMLDPIDKGGLGLSTVDVGFIYGTIGVIAMTIGGILGGIAAAKYGLRRSLFPMMLAINVPNLVYVYFAMMQPQNYYEICAGVAIEQFGYGFGFTAFMLYLIYISQGAFKTAHYAICTGFMALGMMIPGMWAGALQEAVGYQNFFILACICTLPSFAIALFVKIDGNFGRKNQ